MTVEQVAKVAEYALRTPYIPLLDVDWSREIVKGQLEFNWATQNARFSLEFSLCRCTSLEPMWAYVGHICSLSCRQGSREAILTRTLQLMAVLAQN